MIIRALVFVVAGVAVSSCASASVAPAAHDDAADVPAGLRNSVVTPEMGSPHAGDAAPDFTVKKLDGGSIHLADLKGRPVFLHFTGTWCPYCREEIGPIGEIARDTGARGSVVLIDVKESAERWRSVIPATDPALLVGLDNDGTVAVRYDPPKARPFLEPSEVALDGTVLIDKDGIVKLFVLADNSDYDPSLKEVRAAWAKLSGAPLSTSPARTAAPASASAKSDPAPVERPIVIVSAAPVHASAGSSATIEVALDVPAGFHIMNNAPPDPGLIPTTLALTSSALDAGAPQWPASIPYAVDGKEVPTFQGHFVVAVPVTMHADAKGTVSATGSLRYQACSASRCFMPRTAAFTVDVEVP